MTNPTPNPAPAEPPPAPGVFTPEQEAALGAVFEKSIAAYVEKNKPAPDKTKKPAGSFLDTLFGG